MARKQAIRVSGLGTEGTNQSLIVTRSKNTCYVKSPPFVTSSLLVLGDKPHTERSCDHSEM